MEDISKFIGIPWGFNESSWEACDCSGLARLFLREMGYGDYNFDKPAEKEWYLKEPFKAERYLLKNFTKDRHKENLKFADLILCKVGGESHILVYLGYGKVLSTWPTSAKQWNGISLPNESMVLRRDTWEQGFICGFRSKNERVI